MIRRDICSHRSFWIWAAATITVGFQMLLGCGSGTQESDATGAPAEPTGAEVGTVRTDWWFSKPPAGTEFEVVAFTGSSECVRFNRVEVEESAQVITIHAYVDLVSNANCTDDYTIHAEDLRLSEPIGDRAIVGCFAPGSGLRAWDLDHLPSNSDCTARVRDITGLESSA